MKTILLLASAAVVVLCYITDIDVGKSVSKYLDGRAMGRTLLQSNTVRNEGQRERISDDESGLRKKRQVFKGIRGNNMTWPAVVFYIFNTSDQNVRKAFKMGAKVWSGNTCVDIVENKTARDKVVVIEGNGCYSAVGRQGGDQALCLTGNATEGYAVHEIGHVLGLFHTMARYDRDNFIRIAKENVKPLSHKNFIVIDKVLTEVFGLTYDYGSIMHYGELSGSANNQATMIAKNPHYQKTMGSAMISFSDTFMINEHYGCNKICNNSTSAKCADEGYPHPRNCSICICPGGYGGRLCEGRPPGCGSDLTATNVKQSLTFTLGFGSDSRDHFSFCHYMISAPEGKKIEAEVQSISSGYDVPGCRGGGVEIKAQEDQKLTGYRFCSENGTGGPIVAISNPVPVILFNRVGAMQANFTYRYIDLKRQSSQSKP